MANPPTQSPLPAAIEPLLGERCPALGAGTPMATERRRLERLVAGLGGGRPPRDRQAADCCRAGLWLWHDFLDESHAVSQGIDTPEGSWWHGIMHRREPDPGNAKYWFRRVGMHPSCGPLATAAAAIARASGHVLPRSAAWLADGADWDHAAFVDFCTVAEGKAAEVARAIAAAECRVLFAACHAAAWPDGAEASA